jgi:hypothetical protein
MLKLTWDNLHEQFGSDNASIRSFKQAFKGDLAHIKESSRGCAHPSMTEDAPASDRSKRAARSA